MKSVFGALGWTSQREIPQPKTDFELMKQFYVEIGFEEGDVVEKDLTLEHTLAKITAKICELKFLVLEGEKPFLEASFSKFFLRSSVKSGSSISTHAQMSTFNANAIQYGEKVVILKDRSDPKEVN